MSITKANCLVVAHVAACRIIFRHVTRGQVASDLSPVQFGIPGENQIADMQAQEMRAHCHGSLRRYRPRYRSVGGARECWEVALLDEGATSTSGSDVHPPALSISAIS